MNYNSLKKMVAIYAFLTAVLLTDLFGTCWSADARELLEAVPKNTPFFIMADYKNMNVFSRISNVIEMMEFDAADKVQMKFLMTYLREISPLAEISQIALICVETDFKKIEKADFKKNIPFAVAGKINSIEKFSGLEKGFLKMSVESGDLSCETVEIAAGKEKTSVNIVKLKKDLSLKIAYYVMDDIIIVGFGETSSVEAISKIAGLLKSENPRNYAISSLDKFSKFFNNNEKIKSSDVYIYLNNSFLLPYLISKIDGLWLKEKTAVSGINNKENDKSENKAGEVSESESLSIAKVYLSEILRFVDSIFISFKYDNASIMVSGGFYADGDDRKSPFVKYFGNKKETAFDSLKFIDSSFVFIASKIDFNVTSFVDDIKNQFEISDGGNTGDTDEAALAAALNDIKEYVPDFFGEAFFSGIVYGDNKNGFIYGIKPKNVDYCLKLVDKFSEVLNLADIKVKKSGQAGGEIVTFEMSQENLSMPVYRSGGYIAASYNTAETEFILKYLESVEKDKKKMSNDVSAAAEIIKNRPNSFIVTYNSEPLIDIAAKWLNDSGNKLGVGELNMLKILKSFYFLGYVENSGVKFESKFDLSRGNFIKFLNELAKEDKKVLMPVLEKK
ncbi:MAG: hypothetical protein QMC67_14195 [Candidatus Wallbacteria bacterium]